MSLKRTAFPRVGFTMWKARGPMLKLRVKTDDHFLLELVLAATRPNQSNPPPKKKRFLMRGLLLRLVLVA
jgi:hypothetical protein